MLISLEELSIHARCAIYNDLSHMNPRYLTPQQYEPTFHDEEVLYHKKNLFLLSLYFDKIIICTDNVLAFTRYLSKDVVCSVVASPWFRDLVEQGIIVLAGWGSSFNTDMMRNQAEYSSIYRPDLKEKWYVDHLLSLSRIAGWVVREPSMGEHEHIGYLRPLVLRSEGPFEVDEISSLTDLIDRTQDSVGYVGTMELFPFIDKLHNPEKADSFFHSYYVSWHQYCAQHYAPMIPIHTSRIRLPLTTLSLAFNQQTTVTTLYSPDLFQRFLLRRFGPKMLSKILAVEVKQLTQIRNGDWGRFKERYHEYIAAASSVCWVALHPQAHELLTNNQVMDELITEIFKSAAKDTDISALGGVLDAVLSILGGVAVFGPVFQVFKEQINSRAGIVANAIVHRELEPFLKKLHSVLDKPRGDLLIPSTA
ncbi:hypothetical protein [Longimicrobium terrae]|uniref:Uncharacterized protein n=1 Tax=Longimicrobium terrae TaxID=1639882 RepID=A0A841GRU8_9BACT|nr:hypothetical protein [Longimicrobium terrae]MBB4634091.1 hypothetical protein [Longimicrobium terrae]MBB6069019.1 hypothetical protein [Longimicrobium terrae]NNC28196.1 hypothetical protein [Longimicrobium terrae]